MNKTWLSLGCSLIFVAACGTSASSPDYQTNGSTGGTSGDTGGSAGANVGGSAGTSDGGSGGTSDGGSGGTNVGGSGGSAAGGTGGQAQGGSGGSGGSVPPGPPETTNVRIIVEPGDNASGLLAAINGATQSIHMTMYLMTSSDIQDALIAAKHRGVEVKAVLNKTFPSSSYADNTGSYSALSAAGIGVVWGSSSFTYTHEKCFVIDGKEAWIMTMNATASSPTSNREYLAVDDDAQDVAQAEAIFQADYQGHTYTPNGKLLVAPNNARDLLLSFISTASSKVDVEGEEFSDTKIANSLAARCNSGVSVRIVLADDSSPSTSQTNAIQTVKAAGCKVVVTTSPFIHAKAIVVDGTRAYVGSENFTTGSLLYNRELGVFVNNAAEVAKIETAIGKDYANGTPQ